MEKIFFSIYTYENLTEKPKEIMEVIKYFNDNFAVKFEKPFEINYTKTNHRDSKIRGINEKGLKKIEGILNKKECLALDIRPELIEEYYEDPDTGSYFCDSNLSDDEYFALELDITCNFRKKHNWLEKRFDQHKFHNAIYFGLNQTFIHISSLDKIQKDLSDFFKYAFDKFNGTFGHISFDDWIASLRHRTCYEESYFESPLEAMQNREHKIGGYFWGTMLSKEHVKQLGGLEKIRSEAPCCKVEELSGSNGECVYLQLTESIANYSEDDLRKLKNYLLPLLPIREKLPPIGENRPPEYKLRLLPEDER